MTAPAIASMLEQARDCIDAVITPASPRDDDGVVDDLAAAQLLLTTALSALARE